jgi:hypothetical protein
MTEEFYGGKKQENDIVVKAELSKSLCFAMQQNEVKVIHLLSAFNASETEAGSIRLKLFSSPQFFEPVYFKLDSLSAGETHFFNDIKLALDFEYLSSLAERVKTAVTVDVEVNGEKRRSVTEYVDVLAFDEWPGTSVSPELLASFCTPRDPSVSGIIAEAAQILKSENLSFNGYQSGDADIVNRQLAAIYSVIKSKNIAYGTPVASFERRGQKIRLPKSVIDFGVGTCLDTTMLFCACAEAAGLNPVVFLFSDHALCGFWLKDAIFNDIINDDISAVNKRMADGLCEFTALESTLLTDKASSYNSAVKSAKERLGAGGGFICYIDIARARKSGILPLPIRYEDGGKYHVDREMYRRQKEDVESLKVIKTDLKSQGLKDRLDKWKRDLLDITLKNPLISYRLGRSGVPVLSSGAETIENAFAAGGTFQILHKPDDLQFSAAEKIPCADPKASEVLLSDLKNGVLRSALKEDELAKRLTTLYRNEKTSLEETGANTLYLALGFLKWFEEDKPAVERFSPIVLLPIEMQKGRGKKGYTLRALNDLYQINLSLIEMLRVDFEIDASGLRELPCGENGIDLNAVFTHLRRLVMNQKGWDVLDSVSLGTFQFAKFVLWNDLKQREASLRAHPLVSAMITSVAAAETAAQTGGSADAKLYLPMQSDSSQTAAVKAAGEGRTFVLHGPPGTGKSQVITNIIADALAHKKRVLFVAEKIAALDVVKRRLEKLGLFDFCLELHSNKSQKRSFFEQFDNVLELAGNASDVNYPEAVYKLNAATAEFEALNDSLHRKRKAGCSVFEGLNKALKFEDAGLDPVDIACTDITGAEYDGGLEILTSAAAIGAELGEPSNSAFYGCDITDFSFELRDRVSQLCKILSDGFGEYNYALSVYSGALKDKNPKKDNNIAIGSNVKEIDRVSGELIYYLSFNGFKKFWLSIFSKRYKSMRKSRFYKKLKAFLKEKPDEFKAAYNALHTFTAAENELRGILKYGGKFDSSDNFGAEIYVAGELFGNNIASLRDFCVYNSYRFKAQAYPQLNEIMSRLHEGAITGLEAVPLFLSSFWQSFTKREVYSDEYLKNFSPAAHGLRREKFKALTELVQRLSQKEIYLKLAASLPNFRYASQSSSEPGILLKAVKSRGRGVGIRQILSRVPSVISLIKPCMLMSPLSAAQYLPEDYPEFDLVVFDEASQLLTCDAVGAIARAKSAVIVGDPNQLPPTTFFNAKQDDDDIDIELFDQESVLDDMLTVNVLQKKLLWHYRSEHESLIAFSNANYYDNKLITFPTPDDTYSCVEFKKVDGVYDRGAARTNPGEAAAVVDELFRRLEDPETNKLSYGVVTFNITQQNLIQDLVDKRLAEEPEKEQYFSRDVDPVFIKNIESVQGDERDVIIFSVTYGTDKDGKMAVNFGPVNKAGGHRRLNVAVTRAAKKIIVFSTITPDMIDLSRTAAKGVEGLKNFLSYAINPKVYVCSAAGYSKDGSLFVARVADELKKAGYKAVQNVGRSLNKIDVAVQSRDGKFILGILCDNEAAARNGNVRDREYGNEGMLKKMGWNLTRVYALEWWQNKENEVKRLISILEGNDAGDLVEDGAAKELEKLEKQHTEIKFDPGIPLPAREYESISLPPATQEEFYSFSDLENLRRRIKAVLGLEAPLTEQRLFKIIAAGYGIPRLTQRFNEYLTGVIKKMNLTFSMTQNTKFYWPDAEAMKNLAHFRTSSDRKADEIAKEEYAVAAHYIIKNAISIGHEDLTRETANLFGFIKSPVASVRIDYALMQLVLENKAVKDAGGVFRLK